MTTITFTQDARYTHHVNGTIDVERFKAAETHVMPQAMANWFLQRGQAHASTQAELNQYRATAATKRATYVAQFASIA